MAVAERVERERGEWLVIPLLSDLVAVVVPVPRPERVLVQGEEAAPTAITAVVVISPVPTALPVAAAVLAEQEAGVTPLTVEQGAQAAQTPIGTALAKLVPVGAEAVTASHRRVALPVLAVVVQAGSTTVPAVLREQPTPEAAEAAVERGATPGAKATAAVPVVAES